MLALVILSSWCPKEGFMKVSGMCSLLGVYVDLNPLLEAAGGYKASLNLAGIVHSVFRRLQGRFEKSFKHMFFNLIFEGKNQFLKLIFYNKTRVLIRQQYIFEM